jgi:signal peptidase I
VGTTAAAATPRRKTAPAEPRDGLREMVEMVAFVVVLVLLLKSFIAEAFVIPTGSMATTLWGYQKVVTCPQCRYEFPVNCSDEFEHKPPIKTTGATCPNCRYEIDFAREKINPSSNSGDRVLVAKCFYDTGLLQAKPFDVVVFKPPDRPQVNFEPRNYIKRLVGLPDQTIGIWYGDLYRLPAGEGRRYDDSHVSPGDRWKKDHTHVDEAVGLLKQTDSPFEIIRKPPDQIRAMRRIVFDNDYQPKDRQEPGQLRWTGEEANGWSAVPDNGFRAPGHSSASWLRYRHILRSGLKPELITDFMGYNSRVQNEYGGGADFGRGPAGKNWVGDLILECELTVDQPQGAFVLELAKGVDRFRARWQLSSGDCQLFRVTDGQEIELARRTTAVSKKGRYHLVLANVDDRLTLWVDRKLPFEDGVAYSAAPQRGPQANDLQPASIGAEGAALSVKRLKLWRDTYYTVSANSPSDLVVRFDQHASRSLAGGERFQARATEDEIEELQKLLQNQQGAYELLSDPQRWKWLRDLPATTMYVQPDHYLCLGDNSSSSQDGRDFGSVPNRLLQGRALFVYWPFNLGFWPFNPPENRLGPIR